MNSPLSLFEQKDTNPFSSALNGAKEVFDTLGDIGTAAADQTNINNLENTLHQTPPPSSAAQQLLPLVYPESVLQALYEYTPINDLLSGLASPEVINGQNNLSPTLTGLFKYLDTNVHIGNVNEAAQVNDPSAPSVQEFLDASSAIEGTSVSQKEPAAGDLTPYNVPGTNVQLSAFDTGSGMNATVWETPQHKLIIAYSGLNPANLPTDVGAYVSDESNVAGQVSIGQKSAAAFARVAYYIAKNDPGQHFDQNDIYVTGHSTGAANAEYAAQQTGFGGMSFEGTGIVADPSAPGKGHNFVSVDNYGDFWGSYASDVPGGLDEAVGGPTYGSHSLDHYGHLDMVGDAHNAQVEKSTIEAANTIDPLLKAVQPEQLLTDFLFYPKAQEYHGLPSVQQGLVNEHGNLSEAHLNNLIA